ncbi:ArgS-related anticodon-binding protein NrtL [Streptomyces griseoviridis]|uniref:ArgS-related anticodon-binding protein NrtL n=1 Tax=Streptomyces griseoviridis TaxID=45398 RepID=UPI0033FF5122
MTSVDLSRTVLRAVRRAVDDGELRVEPPERVVVTTPGGGGWGDYATNVALQLARPAGQPALRVAEILRPRLIGLDGIDDVLVTGPGFLNIRLRDTVSVDLVHDILRRGTRYGFVDVPQGSQGSQGSQGFRSGPPASPAPLPLPLHSPGDVRSLVVMDVVARLLRAQGVVVLTWCLDSSVAPSFADQWGVRVDGYGAAGSDTSDLDALSSPPCSLQPRPCSGDPLFLGIDAGRWALLHPAPHDAVRLTGDHLVQRESNPLFRVRYAHARARAVLRNGSELGLAPRPGATGVADAALLAVLADHPRVLRRAAETRAPDRLTRHLVAVADAALPFLVTVLPRGDEKPSAAHRARLALAEAAGAVLAGGLSLLGIDAPDHL